MTIKKVSRRCHLSPGGEKRPPPPLRITSAHTKIHTPAPLGIPLLSKAHLKRELPHCHVCIPDSFHGARPIRISAARSHLGDGLPTAAGVTPVVTSYLGLEDMVQPMCGSEPCARWFPHHRTQPQDRGPGLSPFDRSGN